MWMFAATRAHLILQMAKKMVVVLQPFLTPPEEFSAPVHVNFKCIALIVPYYKGALITSSELFFIFHIRKRFCWLNMEYCLYVAVWAAVLLCMLWVLLLCLHAVSGRSMPHTQTLQLSSFFFFFLVGKKEMPRQIRQEKKRRILAARTHKQRSILQKRKLSDSSEDSDDDELAEKRLLKD